MIKHAYLEVVTYFLLSSMVYFVLINRAKQGRLASLKKHGENRAVFMTIPLISNVKGMLSMWSTAVGRYKGKSFVRIIMLSRSVITNMHVSDGCASEGLTPT